MAQPTPEGLKRVTHRRDAHIADQKPIISEEPCLTTPTRPKRSIQSHNIRMNGRTEAQHGAHIALLEPLTGPEVTKLKGAAQKNVSRAATPRVQHGIEPLEGGLVTEPTKSSGTTNTIERITQVKRDQRPVRVQLQRRASPHGQQRRRTLNGDSGLLRPKVLPERITLRAKD